MYEGIALNTSIIYEEHLHQNYAIWGQYIAVRLSLPYYMEYFLTYVLVEMNFRFGITVYFLCPYKYKNIIPTAIFDKELNLLS